MRFFQSLALSALLLLAATSSAWAYTFTMVTSVEGNPPTPYMGEGLEGGVDQLILDVFLDVDPGEGATIISIGIVYDADDLVYNPQASLNQPPKLDGQGQPWPSGAEPSYILYAAGKPTTYMIPLQTPYWLLFPPAPGTQQVNLNYLENGINTTTATGSGIYIATVVLDVLASGDGSANIILDFTSSNIITSGTTTIADQNDFSVVTLIGTPQAVTVPEPALSGLAVVSLVTLYSLARRYRRRAQR